MVAQLYASQKAKNWLMVTVTFFTLLAWSLWLDGRWFDSLDTPAAQEVSLSKILNVLMSMAACHQFVNVHVYFERSLDWKKL